MFLLPASAQNHQSHSPIVQEALERKLDERKEWLVLNQFWKNIFGQQISRIDDPDYFVSHQKDDPRKELISFLEKLQSFEESTRSDQSLQCKFPARFAWLDKELSLVQRGIVSPIVCNEFNAWAQALDVARVVLVFPSAYLNNPASMFGHTLLRLDSRAGVDNPLLSYAASFGAATGEDGGIAFAVKGLLGGYRASFTVEPYYQTVQRYGDIEHRDMWEYELKLNKQEIEYVVKGLWEYGHTFVDYYFFDENCSFYLLALLDTVRSDFGLSDNFSYWAIPTDTLKAVLRVNDIQGHVTYRPSLTTKLEAQAKTLSREQISFAKKLVQGEAQIELMPQSTQEEKALVLEFSFDYLEYINSQKRGDISQDRGLATRILKERSLLPETTKNNFVLEGNTRPEDGHGSGRFVMGLGRKSNRGFYDVKVKPAYHDVLDSPVGFIQGAAIDFLDLGFRQYESDDFQLQTLTLVSVESYSPWTRVFNPRSWTIRFGYERKTIPREDANDLEGSSAAYISGGYGVTLEPLEHLLISILPSLKTNYSPSFENEAMALGGGISSKVSYQLNEQFRAVGSLEYYRFELGAEHETSLMSLEGNYDITKDFIVRANIQRNGSFSQYFNEFVISFGMYF